MTWFRIDDGFADHPKVLACSLAAIGLWTKAGAWCSKHMTDGQVPKAMVRHLGGTPRLASELVAAGLWNAASDGYEFHEWSTRNPLKSDITKRREADARRKRDERQGDKEQKPRPDGHDPDINLDRRRTPRGDEQDSGANLGGQPPESSRAPARSRPVPSRPVPDQTEEVESPPPDSVDPRDDEFAEPQPDTRWLKLLTVFEAVVHNGSPSVPHSVAHKHLSQLLPALESRSPDHWAELFESVLRRYADAKSAKGAKPVLKFFCEDFADWADNGPAGSQPKSPLLRELESAKAALAAAEATDDRVAVGLAEQRLEAAGRAITEESRRERAHA